MQGNMEPARKEYAATPARATYLRRDVTTQPNSPAPPPARDPPRFDPLATIEAILSLDLPPSARLVAIALAKRANTFGTCWPSTARIAADCRLHRVSARRAMRQLVAAGVIAEAPTGARYPNGIPAKAKARIVTFQPRTNAQTLPTTPPPMSQIATNSPPTHYRMIHLREQREAGADMTPKPPQIARNAAEPIRFSQILRIVAANPDPPRLPDPPIRPTPITTPATETVARQVLATYRGAQSAYPRAWLDLVRERLDEGATPAELVNALQEAKSAAWFNANAGRQTPGFIFASLDRVLGLAQERANREGRTAARQDTFKRLAESGSALPSRERPKVAHAAFVPDWAAIGKAIDGRK